MTYITFDGANALKLGIYGYAFNDQHNEHQPTLFDGKTMAIAEPIAEGESASTLVGQEAKYEYNDNKGKPQVLEWTYTKMGYVAYNESVEGYPATIINPAMNFPITITKTEDGSVTGGKIPTGSTSAVSGLSLFDSKKISPDFLKKDYKPNMKQYPTIFKTVD